MDAGWWTWKAKTQYFLYTEIYVNGQYMVHSHIKDSLFIVHAMPLPYDIYIENKLSNSLNIGVVHRINQS